MPRLIPKWWSRFRQTGADVTAEPQVSEQIVDGLDGAAPDESVDFILRLGASEAQEPLRSAMTSEAIYERLRLYARMSEGITNAEADGEALRRFEGSLEELRILRERRELLESLLQNMRLPESERDMGGLLDRLESAGFGTFGVRRMPASRGDSQVWEGQRELGPEALAALVADLQGADMPRPYVAEEPPVSNAEQRAQYREILEAILSHQSTGDWVDEPSPRAVPLPRRLYRYLRDQPLGPEELDVLAPAAEETMEHTLARMFLRLGPPPEATELDYIPAGSGGGGAQQ